MMRGFRSGVRLLGLLSVSSGESVSGWGNRGEMGGVL